MLRNESTALNTYRAIDFQLVKKVDNTNRSLAKKHGKRDAENEFQQ